MVYLAWFNLAIFIASVIMLYFIVKPFYYQYMEHRNFKVKSKVPYILMALFVIMLVFKPVKIDTKSKADALISTYDTEVKQASEIVLKAKDRYNAPDHVEEIKSIISEDNK